MSEETKEKKIGLFDIINDISFDKKYLYNDETDAVYNQFVVNRAFMQHKDTVLLANELNKMPGLSNKMHHDFLFFSVSKRKRYGAWTKAQEDESGYVEMLCEKYHVNPNVARGYIDIMSEETLASMKAKIDNKGGKA